MNIAIAGLGLIGGSFAKALALDSQKNDRADAVYGFDQDEQTLRAAVRDGVIRAETADFSRLDLLLVALPPRAAREFLAAHAAELSADCVVLDVCGTKRDICDFVRRLPERRFAFFGCHPMAGREVSGYAAALPHLFSQATFILTRAEGLGQSEAGLERVRELARRAGFARVVETTPEEHDRIIAYTSQLCHLVSSAYAKSPTCADRAGMTAGSFRDLTRVAYLDESLWTELFLENRDNLLAETERMITQFTRFRDALAAGDESALRALLSEGREIAAALRAGRS